MSTTTGHGESVPMLRTRWFMPAFCLLLGVLLGGAAWIGDRPGFGAFALVLMAAIGLAFAFGGETLRGLGGRDRDERWASIDLRATAISGAAVIIVAIGGFVVEIARGEDGMPYTMLGAVGGGVYLLAVLILRRRS